ncbi:MAG: HEAT repeat domain-containing protein, partial [Anaerolineales bacterium]
MSEPLPADQSEISFDELIVALRDEANPFPARYLYRLSGLEGEELGLIRRVWPQLSFQRRLGVLEDLELLAESNTVMQFDAVNRMALNDEEPELRIVAIRALWPSEQPDLAQTFLDILKQDEDAEVRAQAAAALGRYVYLGEISRIPASNLKDIETELLRVMDSDSASVIRQNALESLGYSGREEV